MLLRAAVVLVTLTDVAELIVVVVVVVVAVVIAVGVVVGMVAVMLWLTPIPRTVVIYTCRT